jgi:O-antigen/teichoic acid export membrane protein
MYFQVLKDKSTLYKLNLISNIATIIFALVLIYFFGVWGAIIENSISWLFMFIVNLFFFLKEKIGINFSLKAELGGIALDFVLPVGRK